VGQQRLDLAGIKAVLLDMDGTLVDSDSAVERAWSTWAGEYGVDVETVLAIGHGSPAIRTVRQMLPGLGEDAVATAAQRQHGAAAGHVLAVPGRGARPG
jgi:sugar-phosphatase